MATLTESIERLRAEILVWRQQRTAFHEELARRTRERQISISRFRTTVSADRAAAGRTWRALGDRAPNPTPTHKRKRKSFPLQSEQACESPSPRRTT